MTTQEERKRRFGPAGFEHTISTVVMALQLRSVGVVCSESAGPARPNYFTTDLERQSDFRDDDGMTTHRVTYLVNGTAKRYGRVSPDDIFIHVGTTDIETDDPSQIFNLAWERLNRVTEDNYDKMLDVAGAPSASVGDIFACAEAAVMVASFGFEPIDIRDLNVEMTVVGTVGDRVHTLRSMAWASR